MLGKCGKCLRYMKLISIRPMRMYCPTCEEVLNLPQVGALTLPCTSSEPHLCLRMVGGLLMPEDVLALQITKKECLCTCRPGCGLSCREAQ